MSSFLRDALRNKAGASGGKPQKSRSSAASTSRSLRSAGLTLASAFSASGKQKKRRRPPVSRLGCPEFYARDPPPASALEGTEILVSDSLGLFTAAHAKSVKDRSGRAWISLVAWSHASDRAPVPTYHEEATILGEVRLRIDRPETFNEINVWLIGRVYLRGVQAAFVLQQVASLLPPQDKKRTLFGRGQKLKGTYVWPFSFQLPPDVPVYSEMAQARGGKGNARVRLPPHLLSKTPGFGADISYTIMVETDRTRDRLAIPFKFIPRSRPIPKQDIPFPFLPTREDWPFTREIINGWSFTPFGGRGRFRGEMAEIEGLIGVQHPAVYAPGDSVHFKLLLYSTNVDLVQTMASPACVRVELNKALILGDGALDASYGLHDRNLQMLAHGVIWAEGQDAEDAALGAFAALSLDDEDYSEAGEGGETPRPSARASWPAGPSPRPYGSPRVARPRPPSPTPSEYEESHTPPGEGRILRMDGRVQVPSGKLKPTFRFSSVAIEYLITLHFSHPEYVHMSPRGPFQAEFPIVITTDPEDWQPRPPSRRAGAMLVGEAIDVSGGDVVHMEEVRGVPGRKGMTGWY